MKLPSLIADRYLLSPNVIQGRISEVFKASDAHSPGKVIAVKVFKFGLFQDSVIQEAFERESQILTALQHPSIIPLIDFGIEPQTRRPYLVLDWGGKDLKASINKTVIRDWDTFYEMFGRGILDALAFAHSRDVVHRDLKPTDLLRADDGRIRLADFGISKYRELLDHNLDLSQFVTEPFTPEGGHDPCYSAASDVFGFGAIVLDFLSTIPLKKWSDLRLALSQVQAPPEIIELLESSISPDPAVRPGNGEILLADIERIQSARRRQSVRRHPCFIQVLPKAITSLKRNEYISTDRDVEALVLREINAGSTIRRKTQINKETGVPEFTERDYWLYGQSMEFHVAVDKDSESYLVLLSTRRPTSSTDFDRNREEGWPHNLEFRLGRHPAPDQGRKTMEELKLGCETYEHERIDVKTAQAEENLFRGWEAILQARGEQAEGNQSVHYTDREIEGNHVTFRTEQPLESSVLEQWWEVPISNDRSVRGIVDNVEGDLVMIYFDDPPRNIPNSGTLRLDARATKTALARQKAALDSVKFGKAARPELKQLILHPESSESVELPPPDKWWFPELDPDKKEAVQRALASKDFFVVHGPPGTGKTTFITELVLQFLARNPQKRVLLTSQTHIGVDNAIERLISEPRGLEIIRVGHQEGKVAESVHEFLLQNKVRVWSEQVQAKAEKFITDWAAGQNVNVRELRLGLHIGQLINVLRQKESDENALTSLREFQWSAEPETSGDPTEKDVSEQALAKEEVQDQIELLKEKIGKWRSEENRLRQELKRFGEDGKAVMSEKLPELTMYQEELIGKSEINQKFRRMLVLNSEWRQRFGTGDDCYEAILTAQHVIAGTCIGIGGLRDESLGEFDLCILDEASKATPTEALVPLVKSKKWVLVGDGKQLPPYIDSTLQDQEVWEKFELNPDQLRETLLTRLQFALPEDHQAQLTSQHRMVPSIGNLISNVFYDGTLKSMRTHSCPVIAQVLKKPVTWFSTSRLKERSERNSGASFLNPLEGQEILKLIERIEFYATGLRNGGKGDEVPKVITIAILSGYVAQTEHISNLLEQKRHQWRNIEVQCNTVDAFQGREADVAIFSVTRSNTHRRAGFLQSRERINVALSRGRNGLCIVGDAEFVRQLDTSPLAEVLDHICNQPDECQTEEIIS